MQKTTTAAADIIPGHSADDEAKQSEFTKKEMNAAYVEAQVQYANGDRAEAAYWHMKLFTDPTQRAAREAFGFGMKTERDAFKFVFNLFGVKAQQ